MNYTFIPNKTCIEFQKKVLTGFNELFNILSTTFTTILVYAEKNLDYEGLCVFLAGLCIYLLISRYQVEERESFTILKYRRTIQKYKESIVRLARELNHAQDELELQKTYYINDSLHLRHELRNELRQEIRDEIDKELSEEINSHKRKYSSLKGYNTKLKNENLKIKNQIEILASAIETMLAGKVVTSEEKMNYLAIVQSIYEDNFPNSKKRKIFIHSEEEDEKYDSSEDTESDPDYVPSESGSDTE